MPTPPARIEFLYWEDCPSHADALARLRQVLQEMPLAIRERLVPFALPATDGSTVTAEQFAECPILGVVFWCNHCPYVKAWEDRLIALQRQYAGELAVARQFGATRTPEVFLFDRDRTLRYHGAPDDNFEDPAAVTHHHLRDAIEALLAGREPAAATTAPRGCTIKWRK